MRIVVAMSGGVDSSVAAAMLAEQGHDVIGLSMQLYDASGRDVRRSRSAAAARSTIFMTPAMSRRRLNIPHYIMNFERQFDEQVVANFVQRVLSRTHASALRPLQQRPQVRHARRARPRIRCDAVATGHYARVEHDSDHRPVPAATWRRRRRRIRRTSSFHSRRISCRRRVSRSAIAARKRCANTPDSAGCRSPTSRTARKSASFPTTTTSRSSNGTRRGFHRQASIVDESGRSRRSSRRDSSFYRRPAQGSRPRAAPGGPASAPLYVLALRPDDRQVVVGPKQSLEQTRLTASGVNWMVEPPTAPSASPRRSAIAIMRRRQRLRRSARVGPR